MYVFMLLLLAFITSGMAGSLIHKSVTSKSVYLKPKKANALTDEAKKCIYFLYNFISNLLVIIEVVLLYLCFEKFLHLTYFNSSRTNSLPFKKTSRQLIQFRLQIRIKDVDLDCKYKDIGSESYCISLSS
ncbi:hypothetical protein Hanom_Chr11g01062111 [Helianthus anomalus]